LKPIFFVKPGIPENKKYNESGLMPATAKVSEIQEKKMISARTDSGRRLDVEALRDPEGAEVSHLMAACPLPGKRILEIGCGRGKLTWQYAGLPEQIVGIDTDASVLRQAKDDRPASIANVTILQAVGEALPFVPQTFDIVLFASSF
jgi:2-polyprenyl-3-methyl-5-hydroxy-6-metoxy-1,4-benzoquinol methylase